MKGTRIAENASLVFAAVVLLLCGNARAQIALHDGSTNVVINNGLTTISTNINVTAEARVLVISLFDRDAQSSNNSPSTLTWTAPGYGAQTITRAVSVNNASTTYADSDIYYLFNPNPGTAAISATDSSGNTPSAMTMQAYTLSGVDTTFAPVTYAAHNANALSVSVTLSSSTPAFAWAVVNASYGSGGSSMYISSSSGAASCLEVNNTTSQCMGYAANLSAGSSTITANAGSGAGLQKMALAVAVFRQLNSGPAAPANLVATAQANQVALSWHDASGGAATNYIVMRSTTSATGYIAIATNSGNTSTSYTDANAAPWTTYYYVVRAVAASGTSGYSDQASAIPLGLPTAPNGLMAVPGDAQAALIWNAQSSATNFNVLRSTTSGSGFTTIASVSSNSYTDSTLTNGTTYYYELNATNSFGNSPDSAQVSATPTSIPNAHIVINASNAVRTADTRWLGINTSVWCPDFNLADGVAETRKAGWTTLRFPGGSIADDYHWYIPNDIAPDNNYANFAQVATRLGATVIMTVNYGSGTAAEAAGWVADANVTNHYGFKYWEIGNECYGVETDNHARRHDPYTYATNAAAYMQQMKAVDPGIKIGVVAVTGETTDSNGYADHPATNLVTGHVFYGWSPVMLSTLRQLGARPDFLIYHCYPESGGADNDQTLLGTTTTFSGAATDLRGQITDFFGSGGTNIELLVTENNSESGPFGKQQVSLVNGLYYADGLGQIMQTEFNARLWWDYSDAGPGTNGDLSTNLYGWRIYGDIGAMMPGIAEPLANRYPPYFAAELTSLFVGGGDKVLNTSSDNPLVSAYAALRTNGTLTLLAINKQSITNYLVHIALSDCVPMATATLYSYGMPQDNAAKAGDNACDIASNSCSVGTNFNCTIAPYSINLFVFTLAPTVAFSRLSSNAVPYGTPSVTLTGRVGANGVYPPIGTAITVTIDNVQQSTAVNDSTGDFSIDFDIAGLPVLSASVTYSSAAAAGLYVATDSSTMFTITPATLTYAATPAIQVFGSANTHFMGTVTGFVAGDTQASATSGTLAFTSTTTATSPAGSCSITGSGLDADDYTFVQAAGNATALTIIPGGLALGGISVSGNQIVFSYPTVPGPIYELQYTTDLSSGAWLPAGTPVPGTGAPVVMSNIISSSPMFFRLCITPRQ